MLHISDSRRYFLYSGDADMRKSFYGLCGLVRNRMHDTAMSGDIFIFISKRRNAIKLLRWEGDGFTIFYKKLEKGTFEIPEHDSTSSSILITDTEISLILKGVVLKKIKYRSRYQHDSKNC